MRKTQVSKATTADQAELRRVLAKRTYFQLQPDLGLPSAPLRVWTNELTLRKGFRPQEEQPFCGLQFSEPPKIAFDRTSRRGPFRDADTIMLGIWLISDRLKALLEQIDLEAFAFIHAEVDYGNFDEPGPDFWFCDVVRMLDCVDEDHSLIRYQNNTQIKNYLRLINVKMRPERVGSAHAFRLKYATLKQIVDDVIVDAIKREQIRGFDFQAIQP